MTIGLSGSAFAVRSMLRDAGTSLAAGDWSLTDATIGGCSASTESTGSTVASRVALWEKRL